MKINFLTTELTDVTGGAIYDEVFYHRLKDSTNLNIIVMDDNSFGDECSKIRPNFFRFAYIYKKYSKDILDCDYLITNSRLYTRFIFFPWYKNKVPKILMIHHHFNFMTENGLKRLVHKFLEKHHLKRAYKIITPNNYALDICKKIGLGNKTILLESLNINNQIEHLNNTNSKNILFVGNIIKRKGLHYAIEAFDLFYKTHQDFKFIIVGSFDSESKYKQDLDNLIRKKKLENVIIFKGRVSDEEKISDFINSKLFLFPSQNEGYGWVMIEAMKHGLPVIAFDNTAMPYTVNNKNGFIIENKNIIKMAKCMSLLVDDEALYLEKRYEAIKTVEQLPNQNTLLNQYHTFFENMII